MYRSHFCGLCNRLRQDYGLPMRFLVNRDATFLSLLGNALCDDSAHPVSTTCCNPMGKPRSLVQEGAAVSYAAAVTLCGLRAKLDDEVADHRRFHPAGMLCDGARNVLARPISRAESYLMHRGFPVGEVRDTLSKQPRIEQEAVRRGNTDLHTLSGPTAFSFGQLLAHVGDRACDSLEEMGRSLGRLIYTLDAVVDRKKDGQTGQFNPFLLQPCLIESVPELMEHDLRTISTAARDLPLTRHRDILEMILGDHLRHTCNAMLSGRGPNRKTRKKQSRGGDSDPWWGWCDPLCCDCGICCDGDCAGGDDCVGFGCGGDSCCDCGGCDCS